MSRKKKKVGTLRKQSVLLPDGSAIQRSVTGITQQLGYGSALYWEIGWIQAAGYKYMVERHLDVSTNWEPEYRKTPWTVVEHIEPKQVKTRKRSILSQAGKDWLDEAVEWMLLEEYGPYETHAPYGGKYWTMGSATPTSMAMNLFADKRLEYVERYVGSEAPEDVAVAFDYYSPQGYDIKRERWVSQVASSLKRLEKRDIARVVLGPGMRGGEVKEYFHREYDED